MSNSTLLLSEEDVKKCIPKEEILSTIDEVFRAHGEKKVIMPAKITLDMKRAGIDSWINAMPGYISDLNIAGIKWAGGFVNNSKKNLPYIMATIILNDPETGHVLAIMEGSHITNIRTGAAAALAAKYSARLDSKSVAFIGTGLQAKMTLRFLVKCFNLKEVITSDVNPIAIKSFKKEMEEELGLNVQLAENNLEAVTNADIIITATYADEALVMNDWVKKGATAISLGSYQEFDEQFVLTADKIFVDNWAQCKHRGELKKLAERGAITDVNISAEMGEVAAKLKPGRETDEERILSIPVGMGTQDIAIGWKVYQSAIENRLGKSFNFL